MFDDVMTLNESDNPTKDCHPKVRHIFPVRYALSESFLAEAYDGKRNSVPKPMSINTSVSVSPNPTRAHQLRRLREGYVYVLYNIGASQPIWRQFQSVWPNNKSESDRYGNSTIYGFRDCAWKPRNPKAPPKEQDFKGYTLKDHDPDIFTAGTVQDFIDIPKKDVTKIWIGYAPAPWPEKLLKAIQDKLLKAEQDKLLKAEQDNKSVRSSFMSEINVENENDPNIMPFEDEESWKRIADFVGPDAEDPFNATLKSLIFNRLDPLPIDHESSGDMRDRLCKRDRKKARIVALRDDLGEAEQMAHLHAILQESYLSAVNDNKYATQIGSMVRAILKSKGLVDRKYFRHDFETRLKKIEDYIEEKAEKCRGPVEIQNNILERSGYLSSATQIDEALDVYNLDPSNPKAQDVYEYACYVTGLATLGMSNSQKGVEVLQMAIKSSDFGSVGKKVAASDFRKIFKSIIGASAKATNAINTGRLKCFEIAVTQHATLFFSFIRNDGGHQKVQNLEGLDGEDIARVFNGGELSHGTIKSSEELVETLKKLRKDFEHEKIPYREPFEGNMPYDKETTNIIYADKVEEIKPSERFGKYYRKLGIVTGIANGAGFFCGVLTLTNLMRHDKLSADDRWNIVATLNGMVQDFLGLKSLYSASTISTSEIASLLTRTVELSVAPKLAATAKEAVGVLSRINIATGVISASVSIYFAHKGVQENDSAAFASNMLMAAGSVLTLVGTGFPPALIAGIICVAVGFIISFFQLSKIEKWAAGCFWGDGPNYIYWDDWQRGPGPTALDNTASMAPAKFEEQLKRSTALGHNDETMKEYFERELTDFVELTAGMHFENIIEGDGYIDLLCDAIQTQEDCEKVEISFFVVRKNNVDESKKFIEHPIPLQASGKKLVSPGHMKFGVNTRKYNKSAYYTGKYGTLRGEKVNGVSSVFHITAKFTAPSTGRTITADTPDEPFFRDDPENLGAFFSH